MDQENNLLTALNEKASSLLNDAGPYSVLDYAWEGEDEPSSEYIGLAMWTTDAPFKPSWHLWARTAPPKKPSLQGEAFYTAGEDFIGTMEMARKAIGLPSTVSKTESQTTSWTMTRVSGSNTVLQPCGSTLRATAFGITFSWRATE